MKACSFVAIVGILVSQMSVAVHYRCERVDDAQGTNVYSIDKSSYVELTVEGPGVAQAVVKGTSLTSPMKSERSISVIKDNSNFSEWFETECFFDSSPLIRVDWRGIYAGISPIMDESHSLYNEVKKIHGEFYIPFPARIMALFFHSGKVMSEFFCYEKAENG